MDRTDSASVSFFGQADLTNCDKELIHIPGSIQPHGLLFVLQEPDMKVVQVSANAESLLNALPGNILNLPFQSLLSKKSSNIFQITCASVDSLSVPLFFGVTTEINDHSSQWDAIVHRSQGFLIVELEKSPTRDMYSNTTFQNQTRRSMARLQRETNLKELFEAASKEVKEITGFDRVMIYRFNEQGHGEVIAESREETLEPFLGQSYPASDIPKQARALYEKNWLRLIPDSGYKPTILVSIENLGLTSPIDLSFSVLRSVSPIHCQYLKNMKVRASMSISLLHDGKLWGLIACHHYQSERYVPYEVRSACELLGQSLSWQLSSKIQSEENKCRVTAKIAEMHLIESMLKHENLASGLGKNADPLLSLTGASGAAISFGGEICLAGKTPHLPEVQGLLNWLKNKKENIFETNVLVEHYPEAKNFKEVASGLLSISLSESHTDFVIWFRPEIIHTVNWAGNPHKPCESTTAEQEPIGPRKSFASWKETVRFQAHPWSRWQIEAAVALRGPILGTIAKKASELMKLNADLEKSVAARDDFLCVASHELKTPLAILQVQVQTALRAAKKTQNNLSLDYVLGKLNAVNSQASRLHQLVETLLDTSKITAGKLQHNVQAETNLSTMIQEICTLHQKAFGKAKLNLDLQLQPKVTGLWDPLRLEQIVTNLLTNALKYGGAQSVHLTLEANTSHAILRVQDQGIGIAEDRLPRIFDRFERAESDHNFKGLGLGLWIVKQILDSIGGTISVRSELGVKSEFIVELPRKPVYLQESLR